MWDFYQSQLCLLSVVCLVALLLERYASSGRKASPKGREDLEDGLAASPSTNPNTLAVLTRQYLIVYAIVMGGPSPIALKNLGD